MGLDIPENIYIKFGFDSAEELKAEIVKKFESIFITL